VPQVGRLAELAWRDELCIGEATIDAQHRGFIDQARHIGALIDSGAPAADVLANITAIVAATAHHFTSEEEIVARHRIPDSIDHRMDHVTILQQITDRVAELSTESPAEEMTTVVRTVVVMLLEHMLLRDMELRRHFLAMEAVTCH